MIELIFRVINGSITLYIAYLLYRLYKQNARLFYQNWSLGFMFYGINIVLRLFVPVIEMNPLGLLAFILNILGFVFMMTGIGELVNRGRTTLILSTIIQVSLIVYVISTNSEQLAWLMVLSPYVVIITSLGYLHYQYQIRIGTIVIGWLAIFLANIALSFNYLDIIYVDIISTVGKIIVYNGMIHPTFSFLVDDLRKFILSGLPQAYPDDYTGGLTLIDLGDSTRPQEINWITNRTNENKNRGIRTILFSFYDLIQPSAFNEETRESLYIVRVIPGHREFENVFDNLIITIDDDPSLVQIVIDDVIKASNETTVPTEILLYHLTNAVIVHGWNRMYSLLMTKMPKLKDGKVKLSSFFYPKAHEDPTMVLKFESLADEIIHE